MKKLTALLLCLVLCLSCVAIMASCDQTNDQPTDTTASNDTTATTTEETTEAPTEDAGEETTEEVTTEEPTEGESETSDPEAEYDPETHVVISSAEDLMAFNKAVNEDFEYFDDMTVVFTADIDMTGYTWTPLDGNGLFGVIFEGNGHTISNLQIADHDPEQGTPADQMGSGFVGVARGDLTFQNLTFENTKVTAYERAVANFVGLNAGGGSIWFENCKSIGFTAEGWTDYNNQNRDEGGHPISFRLAGFIGHIMAGSAGFQNCHVENITLYGFHNLAAFVGYDAVGNVDAFAFEDCTVKNANFYFSYCLASSYTVDMPRKFVSVFYNGPQWVDNIDDCVDMGNSFEGVSFYDVADENTEYTPSDFRSWTAEEAAAS